MKLVRDVLSHVGYRTLEAGDAEAGLELARAHRPDLILMDIQLPGMDGMEALARLRADAATARSRVVALTAFAMKDDRERFLGRRVRRLPREADRRARRSRPGRGAAGRRAASMT